MKKQVFARMFPLLFWPTALLDSASKLFSSPQNAFKGITESVVIIGELTYYCARSKCNCKWSFIISDGTAHNRNTEPIVSANWLPLESVVDIGDRQYRVADRDSKSLDRIGRLDIYIFEYHQAAMDAEGRQGIKSVVISLPGGAR